MSDIIRVKKGRLDVLREAMERKIITHCQIIDALPHELWLDKSEKLQKTLLQIHTEFQKRGVIIVKGTRPVQKPSEFSILDSPLFQNLPDDETRKIKSVFGLPLKKKKGPLMLDESDENGIILVAQGIISLNTVNEEGIENILFFFGKGEFFEISRETYAIVHSETAHIWHFKEGDLKKFPLMVNTCIKIVLKNQNDCLKRILIFTKRKAKEKIKLLCDYLDVKFPDEHFPIESHHKFASTVSLARETVTRKVKKN